MDVCARFICPRPGMVWCAHQFDAPAEDGNCSLHQPLAYVFAGGSNGQELVAPVTAHSCQSANFQNSRTTERMATGSLDLVCIYGGSPGRGTTRGTVADPSKGCICSLRSTDITNNRTGQGSLG